MADVLLHHKRKQCYSDRGEQEVCMNFEQYRFQKIHVCQPLMLHIIHVGEQKRIKANECLFAMKNLQHTLNSSHEEKKKDRNNT